MDAFADLESRHTEILFPSRVVVQTGPIDPRAPFCLAKPVCLGESVLRPIQRAPQVRGRPDTFRTPVGHVEADPLGPRSAGRNFRSDIPLHSLYL